MSLPSVSTSLSEEVFRFSSVFQPFRGNRVSTILHYFVYDELSSWPQVPVRTWTATSDTPSCVYWSETSNEWSVDGVVLEGVSPAVNGTSTITCWTFHLSPFAVAEEASEPVEWSSFSLLWDTNVLLEVGHLNRQVAGNTGMLHLIGPSNLACCIYISFATFTRVLLDLNNPFKEGLCRKPRAE